MMVSNRGSVARLLYWQWRLALVFFAGGTLPLVAHELLGLRWLHLPATPLGVAGGALGIFVSFRTNSCYQRWWEGRALWGKLVNSSRMWSSQVMAYLPPGDAGPSALQARLVRRHAAYAHWLRCALRDQDPFADADFTRLIDAGELPALRAEPNVGHALVHQQLADVASAASRGELDGLRLASMDHTLASLLDAQGGCERIKRTPMPRGYAFIAERLMLAYGFLLPVGLAREVGWATPVVSAFVCLAFALISEAGRVLEDPFTMFWNGLPLSQLSTMIEIQVRKRLGDAELPAPKQVDANGILM